VTILCYHAVQEGWGSALTVAPADFGAHCRWLAAHREVVPLADAVSHLDARWRLPGRMTAITFDDGFRSVYENALRELARHGLPATVFVVTGTLTGERPTVDWVDDPPPTPLATLDSGELLALEEAGVTIASHGHTHRVLTSLSDEECERDLRRSREVLEDLMHRTVPFVAYPRGEHNARVRAAAERAGYSYAFSLPEGPEPTSAYAVPRIGVFPGNGVRSIALKSRREYLPVRTSRAYPWLRLVLKGARPPSRRVG